MKFLDQATIHMTNTQFPWSLFTTSRCPLHSLQISFRPLSPAQSSRTSEILNLSHLMLAAEIINTTLRFEKIKKFDFNVFFKMQECCGGNLFDADNINTACCGVRFSSLISKIIFFTIFCTFPVFNKTIKSSTYSPATEKCCSGGILVASSGQCWKLNDENSNWKYFFCTKMSTSFY